MKMDREYFERKWKELISHYGYVWVFDISGDISIRANGYAINENLKTVYFYSGSELIGVVKLKSIDWIG
jgi:hypothetical protein